ncbi:HAD family hydrolase [Microbacterium sp. TNHR37B]|uniref:HAD family hydrolase n=1 Tax=Microbacterium sp. TNHR37B TaxID=1775956 RepID=UPI0007B19359|nr:HAD family phosphatase [Microbacterium sp. TNHR37B]KZE90795.1 Phosphorylated carbohydrates phosphatase [Microbacterium sp. TNHR37B]
MSSALPAAVLWDMDGTLVDTEPYWMAAEGPLVESFGGEWTHEKSLELVGLGLDDAARVLQRAGVRLAVPEIVDRLTDEVRASLRREGVPFRPGARQLLSDLRDAGVRTALVTMSLRRMATEIVELIDFEAFDLVIGGDDVPRPKPFPDPYLQACEILGVAPGECVAIEDSPNGARSAVAAGVTTIGVPNVVSLAGSGVTEIWPTLEGCTPQDLADALARHHRKARA